MYVQEFQREIGFGQVCVYLFLKTRRVLNPHMLLQFTSFIHFGTAIWMLSRDRVYGGWPRSGEIDIMESKGNPPNDPNLCMVLGT